MPRKLLASSAVITIALVAGGFVIASVQGAQGKTVDVIVRPPHNRVRAPVPPSARLTIPLRYFARGATPSDTAAVAGVERVVLEIEPGDRARALGDTAPDLYGAPLRIEITATQEFWEGLGERRRNEAMNQPPGSPKQMGVNPPDYASDWNSYFFPNLDPTAVAYSFKIKENVVFVDCSEPPRCRGFQTWRGLLEVQYEYARTGFDDPRQINSTVNRLLESFKPTPVPGLESDQSRTEDPVFQPASPSREEPISSTAR